MKNLGVPEAKRHKNFREQKNTIPKRWKQFLAKTHVKNINKTKNDANNKNLNKLSFEDEHNIFLNTERNALQWEKKK